jgi:PhnB protein
MAVKKIPEGFHTVNPYLIVEGADKLLDFLERVFGGKITLKMANDEGKINHAEIRIGDSVLMLSEACGEWKPTSTLLYMYVEDTDATYQKALEAGAKSVKEPQDQFYGDRSAAVEDAFGNFWAIATHIEEVSEEELQRRLGAAAHQTAG